MSALANGGMITESERRILPVDLGCYIPGFRLEVNVELLRRIAEGEAIERRW